MSNRQSSFPQFRKLLDFEPRSCGLCRHARFDSAMAAAVGECASVNRGRTPGTKARPFLVRMGDGTCCERFEKDEFLGQAPAQSEVA